MPAALSLALFRAPFPLAPRATVEAVMLNVYDPDTLHPEDSDHTCPARKNRPCSAAQLAANVANAQHSTGPRTSTGLEASSKNALKTGLTGKTVLLPSDDPAEYTAHVQRHVDELLPIGELESQLVQRIADAHWRLNRIASLERNLHKLSRHYCANMFESETDPEERAALIQAQAILLYEKQFRNLSIQESRIRRAYEKDLNELKALQSQRAKLADDQKLFQRWPAPWPAGRKNGFEFSSPAQDGKPVVRTEYLVGVECTGKDGKCMQEEVDRHNRERREERERYEREHCYSDSE